MEISFADVMLIAFPPCRIGQSVWGKRVKGQRLKGLKHYLPILTRRNPRTPLRLTGAPMTRSADRHATASLSQPPPRLTRYEPELGPLWIRHSLLPLAFGIVTAANPIRAPIPDIAVPVEKTKRVRLLSADRMRLSASVAAKTTHGRQAAIRCRRSCRR